MKIRLVAAATVVFGALALEAAIPLPEHPRPDWERADWVNLNGEWDFRFEGSNGWPQKILVPFGWGAPLSGVKDLGDTGWYKRTITVPPTWKGKRVFVVVGAADHDTNCFVDGEDLGKHTGGYTPFEYELTEFVRWGKAQTLEFKIWDPAGSTAWSGPYLYGKQGYGNARGIWQTVYLEARGEKYLDCVRFDPSVAKGSVRVTATLASPLAKDGELKVDMANVGVRTIPVKAGALTAVGEIKLDKPHLWTLDDPHLYDVKLTLGDDVVKSYFGFREIGYGKNPNGDPYLTLNGKPIYLQLCLDQSYHPTGFYTFPSDEFMKNEILISKKLALSGNRVHIKVEIPRKLYWADKLGVLIQADVPCAWCDASEAEFEEHWKCFEGMVKRDYNHPCVYQWTLFNETWGLFNNRSLEMGLASGNGGKKRAYRTATQEKVAEAYRKAKALDPSRPIEDNSPCNRDHVATDVNTWHAYCAGYNWESQVAEWCRETKVGSSRNFVPGAAYAGQPMMNSECGNVWGYTGSTGDCDFTWDYHLMMNAFRRHLSCGGWLYTEHHDVTNEWNGYVRFDRSWKETGLEELAGMTLADFHRDAALFFAGTPGKETGEWLKPGQAVKIPVGVSFVTDKYAGKPLQLVISEWFFEDRGLKVPVDRKPVCLTGTGKSWQCEKLWDVDFQAPDEAACGCLVMALKSDGQEIARNFWSFGVTNAAPKTIAASKSSWSIGEAKVLDGLKLNGFGKGFFEFELEAPAAGGMFRAELGAKRFNAKDAPAAKNKGGIDYMLGGGNMNRSLNPNSYPQTSVEKHSSALKVYVGGKLAKELLLADDPADHRGILSWLSQPHDGKLREAGSYGYLVEAPVPASAVKGGKVTVRLEASDGLAVYGAAFGRYPFAPYVGK